MDLQAEYFAVNKSSYKTYHESFMQNNTGSTLGHTFLTIVFSVLCTLLCILTRSCKDSYTQEYVVIILPIVLINTLFADYLYYAVILLLPILLVILANYCKNFNVQKTLCETNTFKTKRLISISCLRALTYLLTSFCILAVDFKVFPRYLAKTEQYGYSLMDSGVGSFVLISGLVHRDSYKNTKSFLKENIKLFTILVFLGVARFLSVKHLDYHEHVTEYGVHWNFFFTLAVTKVVSTGLLHITESKDFSLGLSISVCVIHEILLCISLEHWVFNKGPRDSLFAANREGLSSCLGYIALYLIAVHFKRVLSNTNVTRYRVVCRLVISVVLSWLLAIIVNVYRPTSRTLANSGYCCYLVAMFVSILTILYLFEAFFQDSKAIYDLPQTLKVVSNNGLLYFLVSNLFTGAVNFSMHTLFVNNYFAVFILNCYMIISIVVTKFLKNKGIHF